MTTSTALLLPPYGGELVHLTASADDVSELTAYAATLPSLQLSQRSAADLELLAVGAFSPLRSFMGQADYRSSLETMRLANGAVFPIPITLPLDREAAIHLDQDVALRGVKNEILALMRVEQIYSSNREREAAVALGTTDPRHPSVAEMSRWGDLSVSGELRVLRLPEHHDFADLRLTPAQTRLRLEAFGRPNVVAHVPDGPLDGADERALKIAIEETDGLLLLHPAVGLARAGDIGYFAAIRSHLVLAARRFETNRVLVALFPLATRAAGPREALLMAIAERNYGANHLIVSGNHARSGTLPLESSQAERSEAEALLTRFGPELSITPIPSRRVDDAATRALQDGRSSRSWRGRRRGGVLNEILAEANPPRHRQGVCIWLTGLSGAGKSTTAEVLTVLLLELGRQVTLLDGDVVRSELSHGLGFTKEDRDANVRRIGYVAAEVVRHGGVAVCAAVSPYKAARNDVRGMVGAEHFVEVFVDTPLAVCESRDTKGMYARARRGELQAFTGISDPYEVPEQPDVVLDTIAHSPIQNASRIIDELITRGFVRPRPRLSEHHLTT